MPVRDADARRSAATDFARNLVVEAGAGTGKTSLLVERLLVALCSGRVRIDRLAAITFTIKAAGEMRERLAGGLARILRHCAAPPGDLDEGEAADRAWQRLRETGDDPGSWRDRALAALSRLDSARIETIHGFCSAILREFPREAGVDPSFAVDEGDRFRQIVDERWARFTREELGDPAPRAELWERVLQRLTLEDVRLAAHRLASFEFPPAAFGDRAERRADADFSAEAHRRLDALRAFLREETNLTAGSRDKLDYVESVVAAFVDGDREAALRTAEKNAALRADLEARRNRPGKTQAIVDGQRMKKVVDDSYTIGQAILRLEPELIRDLISVCAPFAADVRERFLHDGQIGFDGLLSLTRDLLRDHRGIRATLKRRFTMLLVDEFQDTDPLQYEIVLWLAERAGAEANALDDVALEPGKLFIVGDPKQSIYHFRGADYTAYDATVRRVVGSNEARDGVKLTLSTNFRSVDGLIAPVNALFGAGGNWRDSAFQPPYVSLDPHRSGGAGTRVELWTLNADENAKERRLAEGRLVAREIERLQRDEGVPFGKVTILLRAFTQLSQYLRPLRARGIPFVVDGGRDFMFRPEVADLLGLMRSVVQPSNTAALVCYLRSSVGAVPDTELAAFVAAGHRLDAIHRATDLERFPTLREAWELLRTLREECAALPADQLVRHVLERSNLLTISAAAYEGPQRIANLEKLAARSAALLRDGRASVLELLDLLEQAETAPAEADSPLADERTDAVRVLTVHKAKGLENDHVFLPDLSRGGAQGGNWAPVGVDRYGGSPGEAPPAVDVHHMWNAARMLFKEEQKSHDDAEELRVLYVALTRARERLTLIAARNAKGAPWIKALAPWGYSMDAIPPDGAVLASGTVRHRLHELPERVTFAKPPKPAIATREILACERAIAALREKSVEPLRSPSAAHGDEMHAGADPDVPFRRSSKARVSAKSVGSAAHRLLERLPPGDGAALQRLLDELPAGDKGLAKGLREVFDGFEKSPLWRRLERIEILGREVPLLYRDAQGRRWSGSIDLLYRDTEGAVVVADYKTDHLPEGGRDALAERYREQLRLYGDAVRDAMQLDTSPRLELWLLRERARVTL